MKNTALTSVPAPTTTIETMLASLWERFNIEFPTEEACLQELSARTHKNGMTKCHRCGYIRWPNNYNSRVLVCRVCKRKYWLTAGTFFHRIRCARPWLAAIWLLERGLSISSFRFHTLLNISYSTALSIFKKLTAVID